MKKLTFLFLCLIILLANINISAQESYNEAENFEGRNLKSHHIEANWYKLLNEANPNLFEIQKAYDDYFKTHPFVKSKETRAFEFWKRHIVRDNYDANGNVGKPNLNFDDLKFLKKKSSMQKAAKNTTDEVAWTRIPIKPDMVAPWQSGSYTQGTCNMLAIHPTDTTQMIAAFIDGGTLWRTTDNCATWTQLATDILCRHFGSVVYSKSNPQIVYAGSSQGVIKSTDGGATWAITGYNNLAAYPGGSEIWAMEVHAENPDKMLFAIGGTLYRTLNGGSSFTTKSLGSSIRDIRALPDSANVVFATVRTSNWAQILRSRDFGETWTNITNGYPASISGYTGNLSLVAVSPAEPKSVWVHLIAKNNSTAIAKTYDIYKSTDGGISFSRMNITQDLSDKYWQGTWNQAFAISDTDTKIMAGGAYSTFVTKDGGKTWVENGSMGKTGPHSDVHGLVIRNTTVWSIGDGGFYKSYDYGKTYLHNVDDGIQSHCLWGFDQGWKNDIMALGMYHGPTTIRDDNIYTGWYPGPGADAGAAFVNNGDDRYIYAHPWGNSRITRSTSRTTGPSNIGIEYIYKGKNDMNDPDYYEKVYGTDGGKIMISTNNAASFEKTKTFSGTVHDYLVALTDNKTIYSRSGNTIVRSTDGGVTWTDVSPNTIRSGQNISHMAIDGENPQNIWVTFGGKQNTRKVGKSTNGGDTWINYTGTGLPSYSVNCIINQMGTDGDVYIGTDAGVYYRNNTQDSWTPYSFNLPLATHVGWIKINYAKAKLRIAGQTGIWECDLTSPSTPVAHPTTPVFENEANTDIQIADMSVALSDATYLWDFPGGTPSSSTDERPLVQFSQGGDKNISLTVTDANGSSKKTYNNFIRVRNVGEISKTGWKVIGFDSQETSAEKTEATKAIDGNENTIWGTDWASENPGYPHYISIDMGSSTAIESFNYRGQLSNGNGDVKGYEWYLSEDKDNWGLPVATGEFSSTRGKKVVSLVKPLTGRYFKFVATSQQSGTNWCKASEIGVTGSSSVISAFSASSTLAKKGSEITLNDFSAGNPTSWKWSFPGGTPSSSTEQNPVVTYSGDGLYPVTLTVSNSNGTDILEKESYINITDFVPQSGWSVVYVDSEEMDKEETPGSNAIDGDPSSYWGTDWSDLNPSHPHEIIIDMGDEYPVSGFNYLPRQNNANGRIGSYSFYTSLDNTSWKLQKKNGTFPNTSSEQSVDFSKSTTARYFKLVAFSEVNNNPWTCVAELKMKLDYAILSSVEYIQSSKNINIYSYHNQVVVDNNETSQGLISVFDITGRKLFTTKLNIGSNKILGVQAGIYIVKVMVDNKIISRKVIVRN